MKEYVIDGNNVIHLVSSFARIQKKDKQAARERLAFRIDSYFSGKNIKVTLFYDGFGNLPIKTGKVRIVYSDKKTADSGIRRYIENSKNPKNIIAVSSDDEIRKLARACAADSMESEEFGKMILTDKDEDEEEKRIKDMDDDEFKRLFGVE
jgi:predicted RNA-binding protein with PIN domain